MDTLNFFLSLNASEFKIPSKWKIDSVFCLGDSSKILTEQVLKENPRIINKYLSFLNIEKFATFCSSWSAKEAPVKGAGS